VKTKFIIGFLSLFGLSANIQGQSFYLDSAYSWNESYSCFGIPPYAITRRYTVDQSPWLNDGKTYYEVLVSFHPTGDDFEGTGKFLRQDTTNHVYLYQYGEESLLYDFNMQINDTFYIDSMYGIIVTIGSIDSIALLNGEIRKRWNLNCNGSNDGYFILDGIGMIYGLLDYSNICLIDGCGTSILCLSRNDTIIYRNPNFSPDTCWYSVSSTAQLLFEVIHISPNPASTEISIDAKDHQIQKVSVIDLLGSIIIIKNEPKVDISFLPPGYYFLQIELENHQLVMKRFVKQ